MELSGRVTEAKPAEPRTPLRGTQIADAIRREAERKPGSSIANLARELKIPHSSAAYHVKVLARCGALTTHRRGNTRLVYPATHACEPSRARLAAAVLDDERAMLLLDLIQLTPVATRTTLAKAYGTSLTTVRFHLRKLTAAALVYEETTGRHRRLVVDAHRLGELRSLGYDTCTRE